MQSLEYLGLSYHTLGQLTPAIAYYQKALNLARELGDVHHEIATLGSLGRAYTDLGNYSQAIRTLRYETIPRTHQLGSLYTDRGKLTCGDSNSV